MVEKTKVGLVPGKRYTVFAVRTQKNGQTVWVRAGVAFVQADDSMNISLDVLPIDGALHVRESGLEPRKEV